MPGVYASPPQQYLIFTASLPPPDDDGGGVYYNGGTRPHSASSAPNAMIGKESEIANLICINDIVFPNQHTVLTYN